MKRLLRLVAVLSLLGGMMVAVPVAPSVATMATLEVFAAPATTFTTGAYVHGDGSVSLGDCDSFSSIPNQEKYKFYTYGSDGVLKTSLANPSNAFYPLCDNDAAAGVDGTTFYSKATRTFSGYLDRGIAAAKNGKEIWTKKYQICPSNNMWGEPRNLSVGSDGNLYTIIVSTNTSCSFANRFVSLDAATGTERFSITLTDQHRNETGLWRPIYTYKDGVAVFDQGKITRYSNSGSSLSSCGYAYGSSNPCSVQLTSTESAFQNFASSDGTVYVAVPRSPISGCMGYSRILYFKSDGTAGSIDVSTKCINGYMRATPTGFVALSPTGYLTAVGLNGSTEYSLQFNTMTGFTNVTISPYQSVDADGAVYFVRRAKQSTGEGDTHIFLERVSATGTYERLTSTESLGTSGVVDNFSTGFGGMKPNAVLAKDYIYMSICFSACTSSFPKIYRISRPSQTMDYARSATFGKYWQDNGEPLNYVALGDSFSSGEGVEPFTSPSGSNGCHRSDQAYPMLLDQDSSLNLNLQSFRACSGATTQDVLNGKYGETPQINSVTSETDVVTISIGGNDALFKELATSCYGAICSDQSQNYLDTMQVINGDLYSDVQNLIDEVTTRAPGAIVYVIGYPHLASGYPYSNCSPFDTLAEATLVRGVVDSLNAKIRDAVDNNAGVRFIDPNDLGLEDSPFKYHELCTYTPYFNDINLVNQAYSYHPNQAGQSAYASVVKRAMQL